MQLEGYYDGARSIIINNEADISSLKLVKNQALIIEIKEKDCSKEELSVNILSTLNNFAGAFAGIYGNTPEEVEEYIKEMRDEN